MIRYLLILLGLGIQSICLAQCTIISRAGNGIGIVQIVPEGDAAVVKSIWQTHEQDKVFFFAKRERGTQSASVLVQRQDGRVQGISTREGFTYYISADNELDFKSRARSYAARQIRNLFYLPIDSKTADDEAYLYILAQHLEPLWPIKTALPLNPAVDQRIYYQGKFLEEGDAALQAYAQQVCQSKKKVKLTTGRICDDGPLYFGVYEFTCFER